MVYATKKVKIPAKIGQTKCHIETEVVPAKIPLLLSKASMKRVRAVLDMESDSPSIFSQPVKLDFTSSGHYSVNIMDNHSLVDALQSTKSVTKKRLADCLTKKETPAYQLLKALNDGQWKLD